MANLRILHQNEALNYTTLTTTSAATGFPNTNMLDDLKGTVWRSASAVSQTITLTWTSGVDLSCVILPHTNLTSSTTIQCKAYTGVGGTVLSRNVTQNAVKDTSASGGINTFALGGGSTAVIYFTLVNAVTKLEIIINNTNNPQGYIEVSSLICGSYWSPTYNTSFGIEIGIVDTSEQDRTHSGNLITTANTQHKTLSFDLSFLNSTDRDYLWKILKSCGKRKSVFVSLFPEDTEASKEALYQIYGKFSDLATLVHPMYSVYASSVQIEES